MLSSIILPCLRQDLSTLPVPILCYQKAQRCAIHLSSTLNTKRAGRHKTSPKRDKPLTYEQWQRPDMIGVRKSWNTFSTSGLIDGIRTAETSHEDVFIRKFLTGTWPRMLASDALIKRRQNQIFISFIALRVLNPQRMYFLIGFTEEVLSYVLKSPVKLEIQTVADEENVVYKYI